MNVIKESDIQAFEEFLYLNEKSPETVKKYTQAIRRLSEFLAGESLNKQQVLRYREFLMTKVKAQTVNVALSAIHEFLDYCGCPQYKVKFLKVQRQAFLDETRELSEAEYKRLLAAALDEGNERLYLLMLTVCGTGIRIGELKFITVEAARTGRTEIRMKGKTRTVILQKKLRNQLLNYAEAHGIDSGHIFRTRNGNPMDRSNICHAMKKLCDRANVDSCKVFPHNLRHLFARTFYAVEKNLAHLADVLGHSRIETTRIYVAVSAAAHECTLNKMKLII